MGATEFVTESKTAMGVRLDAEGEPYKWVEPTIPQELVDEAAKEGMRLRPTYHQMKIGYVISAEKPKTRVVLCEYYLFNGKYGMYYKRSKKFHMHDEYGISKLGDVVMLAPCRKI